MTANTTNSAETKTPGWSRAVGVAFGIAILGFIALGVGLAFTVDWAIATGFGVLSLAAICACAGGYQYFLYDRDGQ